MNIKVLVKDKFVFLALISLVLAFGLSFLFENKVQNEGNFVRNITKEINDEISIAVKDLKTVVDRVNAHPDLRFNDLRIPTKYPYYLFKDKELRFWSDNKIVPPYDLIRGDFQYKFIHLNVGKYVLIKILPDPENKGLELFSIIPVINLPKINNHYIQSGLNPEIFSNTKLNIVEGEERGHKIMTEDGVPLFSILFSENYELHDHPLQYMVLLLAVLASLFFTLWLFKITDFFVGRGKILYGLIFLGFGLIFLRVFMLGFDFPFSIIGFDLFNSRFFASSSINPSLGDLLLNTAAIFICCYYLFKNYYRSSLYKKLISKASGANQLISFLFIQLSFFILLGMYELMMNMQKHAQWTLDITSNIDFSVYLKFFGLLIFFIGTTCYFMLSHLVFKVFIKLNRGNQKRIYLYLLISTTLFVSFDLLSKWPYALLGIVHLIYFLIVYNLNLTKYLIRISYQTFIYFFVCSVICAVVGAYTIYRFESYKGFSSNQNIVAKLLADRDVLGEFLLQDAVEKTKNDVFIEVTFSNLFSSKDIIRQKIRRRHLNNYLDKYEIEIHLFDQRGSPLESGKYIDNYHRFKQKYALPENKTEYENIFSVNRTNDLEKGYIAFITIDDKRFKATTGYIILNLRLKRVIPNSVYPELLVDNDHALSGLNKQFSYGLYNGDQLVYSAGIFNVRNDFKVSTLASPKLYDKGIKIGNDFYYGMKGENSRTIVISSKIYPFRNIVSNFSFLFLLLIFIILLIIIFYSLKFQFKGVNLNLATKIQLFLNFAFFLPLFVVSITTLSLLNSSYKEQIKNEYYEISENLSDNISNYLEDYINNRINKEVLAEKLSEIGRYVESDLNLFTTKGKLIASSQPLIYENSLLSTYIHPVGIEAVIENKHRLFLDESVGSLQFKTTYYRIKSFETGDIIGILSIPFFESQNELDRQVIEVLSNIMSTFTFIFIVLLALSYFASRFLTSPLRYITQKIKKISLSGTNTPMVWNSDDEIGLLVGEYNKMLVNLEESKEALTRSEKESAWREMAQQVAHEIKNPLTPMKLNLQHLKRTLARDGSERAESTHKLMDNLLDQIDTLSDIATSFSSFAKMPIPKNKRFDLSVAVKKAVNLYNKDEEVEIISSLESGPFYVLGDEKLIGRIVNNLIINGIQAAQVGEKPKIEVFLRKTDSNKAAVEIKDNGIGIDEKISEKIFIPNFSTKESGSGIGLAISKRGIEHAGGTIWFETKKGIGTSFFIELPLLDE